MKKLMCFLMVAICMLTFCGCSNGQQNSGIISGSNITPMPHTTVAEEETSTVSAGSSSITAAIVNVNTKNMQILVKDIYDGSSLVLTYNGGTDVRNNYDHVITMAQLAQGEIVDITFDADKKKAKTVYMNKDVFRTSGVTGFKATDSKSTITYGSASYMYTDHLVVVSSGKVIAPTEVMSRDVLTVRGIDNKIYSATVDKGHGYLTFSGVDEFLGGMVEIGRSFLYTVTGDMVIVVPEGEYKVTLTNKGLEATKTVYITKDMTVKMDFEEYRSPANKTGTVEFQILPRGTSLFIDGNKVDYSDPVELGHGTYLINLIADGYDTYTTKLTVSSTYQIETFDLAKIMKNPPESVIVGGTSVTTAETGATTASGATTTAPTTTAPTTTASTTPTKEPPTSSVTGSVKLTVSDPAGAGVYINNEYVGTAPVTVSRNPGEYVVTFKKTGYLTKSYIVDVESSDGEQKLSFPAMSEE